MRRITILLIATAMIIPLSCTGEEAKPPVPSGAAGDARAKAVSLLREGAAYLMKDYKDSDGSIVANDKGGVGFTALALTAIARVPKEVRKKYEDKLARTATYVAKHRKDDGSIYSEDMGLANYTTSVAVMALVAFDREKYKDVIAKAQKFLVVSQFLEAQLEGRDKVYAGGWDYDPIDKKRPEMGMKPGADMSNVQFAMEALHYSDLPKDAKTWKRAVKFLSRTQARSESNDVSDIVSDVIPGDDGGFIYTPIRSNANQGKPTMKGGKKQYVSYASMTYAGLKSFIYANVKKNDPRVLAAVGWIRKHYTLDENAGMGKGQEMEGYFYYLHTFAKAHYVWGEPKFKTADGAVHDWRVELINKIVGMKKADGSYLNTADRWFEKDPFLCTAYVVEALNMAVKSLDEQK